MIPLSHRFYDLYGNSCIDNVINLLESCALLTLDIIIAAMYNTLEPVLTQEYIQIPLEPPSTYLRVLRGELELQDSATSHEIYPGLILLCFSVLDQCFNVHRTRSNTERAVSHILIHARAASLMLLFKSSVVLHLKVNSIFFSK